MVQNLHIILFLSFEVNILKTKIFLFAIIFFGICNITFASDKNISAIFFLNNEIFDQFEDNDIEVTLKDFSKTKCKIILKNNLDFKFRPRIKIKFSDNFGKRFEDKKILSAIEIGCSTEFEIDMKNYSVTRRKNTSAWLQIWLDGDKLISEDENTQTWQKISLDGGKNIFNEHYFCVKFDFKIADDEVEEWQ